MDKEGYDLWLTFKPEDCPVTIVERIKLSQAPLVAFSVWYERKRKCEREVVLNWTQWLLEQDGINVNGKTSHGWTALAGACRYHGDDTRFIELLLKHPDIDVNCQDKNGWTPLMNACRNLKNGESSLDIVKLLLAHPQIQPWLHNSSYRTALWMCALNADAETFRVVINSPRYEIRRSDFDITCLVINCFKQRDYEKKMHIMLNCPKIDKGNLWRDACYWPGGRISSCLLNALCYALEHNVVTHLKISQHLHKIHQPDDKLFNRILRAIEECTSLHSVIFINSSRPNKSVSKYAYESVLMNPAIQALSAGKFRTNKHRLFERTNSLAFEKCRNATFLVLLGFRQVLGRDVTKIIAKLVWATRGTRYWHEEDYIFPGERWRIQRLCREVSLQVKKHLTSKAALFFS